MSADMNNRASRNFRNSLAQYLVGNRCHVAFAKKKETKYIRHRIAFLPLKVNMRHLPGDFFNMNQERGDGVSHHRATRLQNAMPCNPFAFDPKLLVEFRRVRSLNFKKNDGSVIRKSMKLPHKGFKVVEVLRRIAFRTVRDDPKRLVAGRLDDAERFVGEFHPADAKLRGTRCT